MNDFDIRLAEAVERYVSKPDNGSSGISPDLSERVSALLSGARPASGERSRAAMKRSRIIIIAAAAAAAMTLAAVAAPIINSYLNSKTLVETSARKTEVPDGWIGIYDAEGLNAVRDDLNANYILMEDIDLSGYENWMPIGSRNEPFMGGFDGNGHVVRNMTVDFTAEEQKLKNYKYYLGLFGYVMCMPEADMESIVYDEDEMPVLESVRWHLDGYVKNLGLEDSKIVGVYDHDCVGDMMCAGGIAAYGDYILGCYVKNTSIDILITEQMRSDRLYGDNNLKIGGIAGEAYLIDSCWTDADITVKAEKDVGDSFISGIAGVAGACVTSYFNGTVDCGDLPDNRAVCFRENRPPKLITNEVMTELIDRLNTNGSDPYYGENGEFRYDKYLDRSIKTKDAVKLHAFYTNKNLSFSDAMELVTSEPGGDVVWFFDPYSSPREYKVITEMIAGVFTVNEKTGERESFIDYCREHGLKYGVYYTYDLRFEPDTDFEGFDFDNIWKLGGSSTPELRIFGQ